jgi:ATP-dependent DNA helicase DinG
MWLSDASKLCKATSESTRDALLELMNGLRGDAGDAIRDSVREEFISDVGRSQGRINRIVGVWNLMATATIDNAPVAKWIELNEGDLKVCASPVGVGLYLMDSLWSKVAASVHLSATICTVGGFGPYMEESGLSRVGDVETLSVESPFDFERQACLVIPKNVADAKDSKAHTKYLIEAIPEYTATLNEGEGALMLFSSWGQLKEVCAAMPQWIKDRMLSQESMSRTEVLARHDACIKAGRSSFIFATAAYEEGVDLRGNACKLVVIAKLPFSVPTDPVSQTQKEHMESQGRSHFNEVVIPQACRRLAQGMGRLLRSETDSGHIVLADGRLTGTRYGREILATLPPYRLATAISA